RGLGMRLQAGTLFPAAMAFGATGQPQLAERYGEISAQEARALGVQLNFFPVADVNSNPVNPIINTRSFGEDPQAVGEFVAAYIRGAKKHGMLSTAKHFPGTVTLPTVRTARPPGWGANARAWGVPGLRRSAVPSARAVAPGW